MLPVDTPAFWKRRMYEALASGQGLHTVIYVTDPDTWNHIQNETAGILQRHVLPGMKLLDAGCGYGAACDLVPPGVTYIGIDISPDLLEIAHIRNPQGDFRLGNLADLSEFPDQYFDYALCRSMRDMVVDNQGMETWELIQKEIKRVARKIISIEYESPSTYKLI